MLNVWIQDRKPSPLANALNPKPQTHIKTLRALKAVATKTVGNRYFGGFMALGLGFGWYDFAR